MTAPEPTGITDRTVELWTAGQLPRPNLTYFTKAEAFEEGFERGQAHGRSEVLEIVQLNEIADDGEVMGRVPSWYCEGHVDRIEFIRALVDHCVDYGDTIPSIDPDSVKHQFLRKVGGHDGSWTADFRDDIPAGSRRKSWEPVTTFEVTRRFGGVACSTSGCTKPVSARVPVRAVLDAKDGNPLALYFSLCAAHRSLIPDPQYRVCLVPVGATVVMPASDDR